MIEIDGSYLEGGGQIVRTAVAFSTLTGQPIKIINIRKGRASPGLKAQHVKAIETVSGLCNADVVGLDLGSTELSFRPGKLVFKNLKIDIGTAGSITLLLQAVLPLVIFSDKRISIKIRGGTDTAGSMPVDYFMNVFLPHLKKYADIDVKLVKRGYYPKGGGELTLKIRPKYFLKNHETFSDFLSFLRKEDKPIVQSDQGNLLAIFGRSHASKDLMAASVAERQAKAAKYFLGKLECAKNIDIEHTDALSTGSGITLWAFFSKYSEVNLDNPVILGSDALGARGKKSEKIGEEAAKGLIREINSGACADSYLGDQLLPFMALFGGEIAVSKITDHCRTNMQVIENFLDRKFRVAGNKISI